MEENITINAPKPNPLTTVTTLSKTLALILFISLPFLGFYLGMGYQESTTTPTDIPTGFSVKKPPINSYSDNKCLSYGWNNGEKSLPMYKVKAGDTLLSVAKNQLRSVSRVGELINLNKTTYPSLSLTSPFIEVGWVLLFPPEKSTSTSGNIKQMDGELEDTQGTFAWVIYSPNTGGTGPFRPNSNTALSQTPLQKGDCVSMIYDQTTGVVYSILPQIIPSNPNNQATPSSKNGTNN